MRQLKSSKMSRMSFYSFLTMAIYRRYVEAKTGLLNDGHGVPFTKILNVRLRSKSDESM